MSKSRKAGRSKNPKRPKNNENNDVADAIENLLPSDEHLRNREKKWMDLFRKYGNSEDEASSDIDLDKLTDLYTSDEERDLDSSNESVKSEDFVEDASVPDELEELDVSMAQLNLENIVKKRKENWASNGFTYDQLADQQSNFDRPNHSWLFQSLVPDVSVMSTFHKSSTSTVTEKKEMSTTSSNQNQTVNQKVELTKTITTIVQQVMVHSSHASAKHLASSALALTNSPLSDDVFTPPNTSHRPPHKIKSAPKVVDHSDSELSSNSQSLATVHFGMPKNYKASAKHPSYRKTPFKKAYKSCLKNATSEVSKPPKKSSKLSCSESTLPNRKHNKVDAKSKSHCRKTRIPDSSTSSIEEDHITANWKKCTSKNQPVAASTTKTTMKNIQTHPSRIPHEAKTTGIVDLPTDFVDIQIDTDIDSTKKDNSPDVIESKPKPKDDAILRNSSKPTKRNDDKRSAKENRKPTKSRHDQKPPQATIPTDPVYDPKASAFNPRLVLRRIDISEYQQGDQAPARHSSSHQKLTVKNQAKPSEPGPSRPAKNKITTEPTIPIKSSKTKRKTPQEKIESQDEIPRRASQLAMPPPPNLPVKTKSKSSTKQSASASAKRTKALYSDVIKGDSVPDAPQKSKASFVHTAKTNQIAAPSEFNSNNTITGSNLSTDDNFHLQLHSTANSTNDDLTIQRQKEETFTNSSLLNATDSSSTFSTIIFSPTKNSTAHDDKEIYRLSANDLAERQKLTSREQLRIFGKPDSKAELVVPANAMYTLVRKVGNKAAELVLAPAVTTVKKKNKQRKVLSSSDSSDSDETDILDIMRGIVIEKRIIK